MPLGRLVFVGHAPDQVGTMERVCLAAFDAVLDARGGTLPDRAWWTPQAFATTAGHHCGYLVGIGFPPSWTGGNWVTRLRHDSDLEIRAGMSFHILSWLIGTGAGDYFVSDTVLLTDHGPEVLTAPRALIIR